MKDSASSILQRYWLLWGGLLIAFGYLPMLQAPFDFTDDGNLVYAAPAGTTGSQYLERWWDKVAANVHHLGPFRPVLWAHWELAANCFADSPIAWRAAKMLWCAFAATTMLWLMSLLRLPPMASLLATAAAIWNPYRNEIWTSLTLAEGIAMPYAMLALIGARKASSSSRSWPWDLLALVSWFFTLGCKNTFVALFPAMLLLRCLPDGSTLRVGLYQARWALCVYWLPLLLPAAHFVYFKLHWQPGQYETPGPSAAQMVRIFSWMKGAAGLDFIGIALLGTVVHLFSFLRSELWAWCREQRAALLAAILLTISGVLVYVPVDIMAARYTMPAIWGVDIAVASLFAYVLPRMMGWSSRGIWLAIGVGLLAIMFANIGRQERLIARHRLLWDALRHVEQTAPKGATIEWVSGETGPKSLNVEEGIHFAWHLHHRGRFDVKVGLFDGSGQKITRVELPPLIAPAEYRFTMNSDEPLLPWRADQSFSRPYRFGQKTYAAYLQARVPSQGSPSFDPWTMQLMKHSFDSGDANLLKTLTNKPGQPDPLLGATAELKLPEKQ
jgi:hypothetical protein